VIGLIIGVIMQMASRGDRSTSRLEKGRSLEEESAFLAGQEQQEFKNTHAVLLFAGLLALLILGARDIPHNVRLPAVVAIGLFLAIKVPDWFSRDLIGQWMRETGYFLRLVLPILLPAVLVIGLIQNNAWGWIYDKVYPLCG